MARADLSAMLGRLSEDEAPTVEVNPQPAEKIATTVDARSKRSPRPVRRPLAETPTAPATVSGYLSFERKETRLRADQYAKLTQEARRLNKAKGTGGERITENTLIRVAIDLLLERADKLSGATEQALRESVSP